MGFSFRVELGSRRPSFEPLSQPAPVMLGAGSVKDGWPEGTWQHVPDVAARPTSLQLLPALGEVYQRAGATGRFLATVPARSTRGVEVGWQRNAVCFRVPVFGSLADYDLAVHLAAATARAGLTTVLADHGPDGRPTGSLSPDAALKAFDSSFAARHQADTAGHVLNAVAAGETFFVFAPRGWVAVGPALLAGTPRSEWLGGVLRALGAPGRTDPAVEAGAREVATLLTRAMVGAADLDDKAQAVQLRTTLLLDADLRGYDFRQLLNDASAERDLGGLRGWPSALRTKALVLAAEVVAAGQQGGAAADTDGLSVLAATLKLDDAQAVLECAQVTFAAKFATPPLDGAGARAVVEALLLAGMADGRIDPLELGTCVALGHTVPSLGAHALADLVSVAEARIVNDMADVVADLGALGEAKNQAFVLACEVAFANSGLTPRGQAALRQLRDWLKPDEFVVESALLTFSQKQGEPPRPAS